jgi:hypothetical protein
MSFPFLKKHSGGLKSTKRGENQIPQVLINNFQSFGLPPASLFHPSEMILSFTHIASPADCSDIYMTPV